MAQSIGTVTILYGQALAEGPEGSRALAQGSPVYQGETIATGHESTLEIRFLDKSVLAQGADSRMTLDQYGHLMVGSKRRAIEQLPRLGE